MKKKTLLFGGYAPVHFVFFKPIYDALRRHYDVVAAVRGSLAHPVRGSQIRRAMAKDLFYEPGTATSRALAWILGRLRLEERGRAEAA